MLDNTTAFTDLSGVSWDLGDETCGGKLLLMSLCMSNMFCEGTKRELQYMLSEIYLTQLLVRDCFGGVLVPFYRLKLCKQDIIGTGVGNSFAYAFRNSGHDITSN